MEKMVNYETQDISKMTTAQAKSLCKDLIAELEKIKSGCYCHECGKFKPKKMFYVNYRTPNASGVIPTCKECLYKIATGYDPVTKETHETRETIIEAFKRANLPFLQDLYESSLEAVTNETAKARKKTCFNQLIVLVQSMPQYQGMTFDNSDFGSGKVSARVAILEDKKQSQNKKITDEIEEMYVKNKRTVLRMLGYDPFLYESDEDKPLLYSKLVNYFDDSIRDDNFKLEAVIQIVNLFKDAKKIDDSLTQYVNQLRDNPNLSSTIKSLTTIKKDMITSALALAKDNGISEINNKNKAKGAGTLSGLLKEMSEMNLDEVEINTFTYETNIAIEDIMRRNYENQLRQLNPDENDWEREVVHQKELIFTLQKERDNSVELCRLLRKENKDLKDYLREKNLIDENDQVIINEQT